MIRIYAAENYDEMSEKAARIIVAQVIMKPECVLGLATGSSPVGTYQRLVERYKAGKISFAGVTTVNLDEYKGLSGSHDQSYRYFMQHNLFDHVDVRPERTHVPNGEFVVPTHVVDLTESTIKANARFFASRDEVPRQALTMGVGVIMGAKKIVMVASGVDKADAVYGMVKGPVTPGLPASILQLHPDVTLVADKAALSKL